VLNTFFRSAAHATDSTLIGCSAKQAATIRLRQRNPVALCSSRKRRTALTTWSKTFRNDVRRVQAEEFEVESVESQVRGCQFALS